MKKYSLKEMDKKIARMEKDILTFEKMYRSWMKPDKLDDSSNKKNKTPS